MISIEPEKAENIVKYFSFCKRWNVEHIFSQVFTWRESLNNYLNIITLKNIQWINWFRYLFIRMDHNKFITVKTQGMDDETSTMNNTIKYD